MRNAIHLAAAVCVTLLSAISGTAAAGEPGQLYHGWATTSITPEQRAVAVCGQYETRISAVVHDPVQATVLALETRSGGKVVDQAVLVSCDLVAIRGKFLDSVRERVRPTLPDLDVRKIVISATHTHTAPALADTEETDLHPYDFMGSWAYRIPEDRQGIMRPAQYVEFLVERLAAAVVTAWQGRRPGGVSSALGNAVIARNRRAVYKDGHAQMYGRTDSADFSHIEGKSDSSVDVLFFWRGKTLTGIAINVYCPSQEVENQLYLSADFWYDTRKLLRDKYHADLHVLSLCGAAGDQSPHLMRNKNAEAAMREQSGRSPRQEIAHRIMSAVSSISEEAREHILTELPFEHRVETVPLPVWKVSDKRFNEAQAVFEAGKDKTRELSSRDYINWRVSRTLMARYERQKTAPHYDAELHLLRLADVALATNPFELFTEYGTRIKARSPAAHTLVVQLTADCAGYLPTRRAVAGGGYSARIVDGVIGPEGGDVLVDKSVEALEALWSKSTTESTGGDVDLLFGGCGGVYFLAEPGELEITLEKRDRNLRGSHTELRAILVGPDREVLQEVTIPDDGHARGSGLGPAGRARLSTRVARKGVFALNVTVSRDRYGREIVWGFRTNCPKYLIETSRGHKDERHQEPIVLASPGRATEVCFSPRPGAFNMEVAGLPAGVEQLRLLTHKGTLVETMNVADGRVATTTVPATVHRDDVPWRLQLPSARATLHIDGVTRWSREDRHPDLCYWTPHSASWFPFLEYRWLLTPYRRTVYEKPGREHESRFRVRTSSDHKRTVQLALEFPESPWPVRLTRDRVSLDPRGATDVSITYTVPAAGESRVCHLRATCSEDPGFSTYSTLRVIGGEPPASTPLDMPIALQPYRHENEQLGYLPDYPVESQVYFDLRNRPAVATRSGVTLARGPEWVTNDFRSVVKSRSPNFGGDTFTSQTSKIAFDQEGDMYAIARCGSTSALIHSSDDGASFSAYAVPGPPGGFDIEQFSGHNVPEGPPPLVRLISTGRDPKLIWRRIHDLELFVPEKVDGTIELGEPILLSKKCIGISMHSGIPSTVVSRGSKVHVAWGEATDPKVPVPGVPTYVATFDRDTGTLGEPALIGYGPPANDVHNSPSITMDSRGYLHVLIGTHGRPFQYARSLQPNDASGGWTEPEVAGKGLNQTYIGMVCGDDDTLHVVFRLWRSGPPFPHSTHATLAYQRKRLDKPWEPPKILVVAPFSEYSIFYHRLTIDRKGRLFLSYDYWSTFWFYRLDHPGSRRALLTSPDGGDTWALVAGF